MLTPRRKSLLFLTVGIGLLINPYAPGVHSGKGSVHQYEAAIVTYNQSTGLPYNQSTGLQVTDPEAGRELRLNSVDSEIICAGLANRRVCQFEDAVYDGTNVSSVGRSYGSVQYELVYLHNTLYRPTTVKRGGEWYMSLNRVNESDPLQYVADSGILSEGAQRAIATGSVMTYRELPEDDTIVRYEGQYYTLYTTGVKNYGRSGGGTCSSSGDGFCSDADSKRRTDSFLTVGSWLLGVVLVVSAFQSRDPT